MEGAWLSDSLATLQGHNVSFAHAVVNPRNVQHLIRNNYGRDAVNNFLKVDIDSFDVRVLQATLQVLSATLVTVEFDPTSLIPFVLPCTFRRTGPRSNHQFKYCRDEVPSQPQDYTCCTHPMVSILYLVGNLSGEGYSTRSRWMKLMGSLSMNVLPPAPKRQDGLRFPIDEWACCMQTPVITKPWPFPAQFTQEWMADDVYTAFSQLWSNVSRFSHINHFEHVPFTLDIAGGSHKVKWSLVQRITGSKGNEAAFFISCFKGDEFVMNHDESRSFGAAFGFAKSFMAHGRIHHNTHI